MAAAMTSCAVRISAPVATAAPAARSQRKAAVAKVGALSGSSTFFSSASFRASSAAPVRGQVVMSAATDAIVESLKNLTLLEASELVKQIEATFGVDASAPVGGAVMMAPAGAGGAAEAAAVEEKTEWDVVITDVDAAKRIGLIKVVRSMTPLGLKEAKDAVTTLPSTILAAVPKEKAMEAKKALEEGGAKVELK
eukprot:jgi/Mesvir1/6073/Mv00801-RA.1